MSIVEWLKEWAIPLSAGATFLLAIAAFGTIWQNHLLQKKERRERLLNEIIEWAIEITKHPSGEIFEDLANVAGTQKVDLYMIAHIARFKGTLKGHLGRHTYILSISSSSNRTYKLQ